jgi:hypothetical protein
MTNPMRRFVFAALLSTVAISLLSPRSFAQSCPAGDDNMLDWMTLDTATSQHLTGPQALPLYSVLPSDGLFWLLKGDHSGEGYPWDLQYYDSTYIYQWITDSTNSYTDPTNYKAFNSKTGMPWTPICIPEGTPGEKLSSITVPNAQTAYTPYGPSCAQGTTQYLGNTVNEVWNYGNLNIDSTTPPGNLGTHPDLQLVYRYGCDENYNNCTFKEVFDLMQSYGEVRWTKYQLISGSYQQQQQTVFNQLVSGGSPAPYFPCTMP